MACDTLKKGRAKGCKDGIGGTSKLYLFDFIEDPFTVLAGEATAVNAGILKVYEYDLVGDTHPFTENKVPSRDNGTVLNTQTIIAQLPKQDAATSAELNIVAQEYPQAVVKDRNGIYHAVGIDDGIDFTIDAITGSAKADFNGYTITGVSTTQLLSPKLDSATVIAFLALV